MEVTNNPKENEEVVFAGKIGAIVHMRQPDGRVFEQYRRPPGVRLILVSPEKHILLTKEYRHEPDGVDLRLPGGKVCDTWEEYQELMHSGKDMLEAVKEAGVKESIQETGYIIHNPNVLEKANAGATVDWD